MEEQKRHLLSSEDPYSSEDYLEDQLSSKQRQYPKTESIPRWRHFYFISLHVIIVSLLIFIFKEFYLSSINDSEIYCKFPCCASYYRANETAAPAQEALHYTIKNDRQKGEPPHTPYTGYPNAENNRAWEELIEPIFFNATDAELIAAGTPLSSAVRLAEGGHVGSLAVYHELHCLRRIRLHLYSEVYFPNITSEEREHDRQHLDHCIETLRQSVMCRADQGVYTFFWSPKYPNAEKPLTRSDSPRKCVDWTQFEAWTKKRMISLHPRLIKPTGEYFNYGSESGDDVAS
ncbi:hypothetical protein N0V90_001066 [Kalmusia sp. IMI 367209]|nr:hypothetical protein N0V90_001066 [Kalmusia sp. IMI 367209]